MTDITPAARPEFFGKDKFVPFLGQVEDVNDPKRAGRVKVRCVGWHPKEKQGKEGLKTDDLPWARVGMDTTKAQQSRIGGKHGLLPGCWVWGFFLDGDEAQQPFVVQTFNFTPNASEKDYRKVPQGQDGKLAQSDPAYGKTEAGASQQPNISTRTEDEQGTSRGYSSSGDVSGDVVTDEADDPCTGSPTNKSAAAARRMDKEMKEQDNSNAESQNYKVTKADGLCGSTQHARDDIKKKMMERLPSNSARFTYGDVVWNRYNGNFINLNGLLLALACEISSFLKQPSQSSKSQKEEKQRKQKAQQLKSQKDRDGNKRKQTDEQTTQKSDMMHAMFAESLIDMLCNITMQMLQNMNNGGSESGAGTNAGGGGTNVNTNINNYEALCLTDNILNNVDIIVDSTWDTVEAAANSIVDAGGDGGGDSSAISAILGALMAVMQFPLTQKYAKYNQIFNRQGKRSQDKKNKEEGCSNEREYKTNMGGMMSLAGFGGGGGAGGGAGGSGGSAGGGSFSNLNSPGNNDPTLSGFGGYPGANTGTISNVVCEEATEEQVPDPAYDNGTSGTLDPTNPIGTNGDTTAAAGDLGSAAANAELVGLEAGQVSIPRGQGAIVICASLPSKDQICARNFINGVPNVLVVVDPGRYFFYNNVDDPSRAYPSIYVPKYNGVPRPVVDAKSGELVAVTSNCSSFFSGYPNPPVTVIPDDAVVGIRSDDPRYRISLSAFYIENTGFFYTNPTIRIIDKDTGEENGKVEVTTVEGRIVDIDIINTGDGFRRIPEVRITDETGYGAVLRPIMGVELTATSRELEVPPVEVIYCPAKNQRNLL